MKKTIAGALAGAAAMMLLVTGGAEAKTYNLTLCGASPGGLWSLLGAGVDAAVKKAFPGSTVTYQTSGGGLANVALLDKGQCDLAIIHDAEAKLAIGGKPPFQAPITSMATVAQLYTWAPMQAIINADYAKEHNVTRLEDIAAQKLPIRIALNKRGNIVSSVGESMLNAIGASPDNIKSWGGDVQFAASGEQGDLMRDRRIDMILNSLFVNHSSIRELASSIDVKLLPITEETAKTVIDEWDIKPYTIKNEAYDWTDQDVLTVTVSAQLFVRADADEAMVHDIAKALVDNVDQLNGVHKAMAPLDVKLMAGAKTVPYHPAAKKVYEEAGY
ncbi:ABC transporter substrate-binding protein [Zhengella mangrovi]|uniref:ABC transporter substrate-binding protein n=1 Tax=Zhengella mangrovi TaxID=1982044 RepID=A0A2G1QKJ3_9HYPH|nr:TAXI family TRAP transporter solute-binding subunit [Zhengella mangrovi]PHP65970.1 ABC transporter substrate-binding protein [Zhengella mangrovi]